MSTKPKFQEFAFENLKSINHPTRNNSFVFQDLNTLIDLFFTFLYFDVEEPTLKRIRENFENDFERVYNLERKELAGAIEGLATNFESFLKKIALIKFNDETIWKGDGIYRGITKCSLFELIEGKAGKIHPDGNKELSEFKPFPSPIVTNEGITKAVLDFVRDKLRNSVHSANTYSRSQLISYSNLVLGAYLIAVNDNLSFLKSRFFPEYSYLNGITRSKSLININRHFIDIYGKQEIIDFDNVAVEQLDANKLLASLEQDVADYYDDSDKDVDEDNESARVDTVLNISYDTNRFLIIGEPGSGKTTSLQMVLYNNALGLLQGDQKYRLPIYIKASSYSPNNTFLSLIRKECDFLPFDELVEKHKVLLLIDGLNEIEDDYKRAATLELKELLEDHPSVGFVITTRKYGFYNHYGLKVFELKQLNYPQIQSLIINIIGEEKGKTLWDQLQQKRQILDLAANPLMLMMIIKVSANKTEIPSNKGLLFKLFNDAILTRERKFYSTEIETKIDTLSHLAFKMRDHGLFKKIKKAQAKAFISEKLSDLNRSIGVNEILNELIDNNFFLDKGDEIEFYHETQQEYFVALEFKSRFFKNRKLDVNYEQDKWLEPLIICSDLINSNEDRLLYFHYLIYGERSALNKRIDELNVSDLNEHFYLAFKVANNLRYLHPELFSLAETYVLNYLTVWIYKYLKKQENIEFDSILKAIASLSSARVFERTFFNLDLLEIMFYSPEIDNGIRDQHKLRDYEYRTFNIIQSFLGNISDFTLFFNVLDKGKLIFEVLNNLSKSVFKSMGTFKHHILENAPLPQLVETFKATNSKEVLYVIGKSDLDFFIENYFATKNSDEKKFFRYIAGHHIRNNAGFAFLLRNFTDASRETTIRLYILKLLISSGIKTDLVLQAAQDLVNSSDVLIYFDEFKALLNRYPLSQLSVYGLHVIYTIPEIEKTRVSLKHVYTDNEYFYYETHNKEMSFSDISNNVNSIYLNDEHIEFENVANPVFGSNHFPVFNIHGAAAVVENCYRKYPAGGRFSIHYMDQSQHSHKREFEFWDLYKWNSTRHLFMELHKRDEPELWNIFNNHTNIEILIGQEFRFSIHEFTYLKVRNIIKCRRVLLKSTPELNEVYFYKAGINFNKPYNYHRDILKSNEVFLRFISMQEKKSSVINFIKAVGLGHVFINEVNHYQLGLVIQHPLDSDDYRILVLGKTEIIQKKFINSNEGELIEANDFVIMEANGNISRIGRENIRPAFFTESEIISVHNDGSEGFIEAKDGSKDYYFLRQMCDFSPQMGYHVRFIPGLNFSKHNSRMPMAYQVELITDKFPLAVVERVDANPEFKNVRLRDIHSSAELFARVYPTMEILNDDGIFMVGDMFRYFVPDKFKTNRRITRIYLISKESSIENEHST